MIERGGRADTTAGLGSSQWQGWVACVEGDTPGLGPVGGALPGAPFLCSQACPGSHVCPRSFEAHLVTDTILFFYVWTCFSMRKWTRKALEPDGPVHTPFVAP